MNDRTRNAHRMIKARRAAGRKCSLSTYVARQTKDTAARKTVTNALRNAAKPLRESGALGKVQTRVCFVAPGVAGKNHRYTAAQVARIAAAYRPRKAEYKAVRAALLAV